MIVFIIQLWVLPMKKYMTTFSLCLLTFCSQAHEFLTQILVYPENTTVISPDSNTYHIVKTYNLSEQQLLNNLERDLAKQEMKRIVAKRSQRIEKESIVCDDWDMVLKTCGAFDHFNEARSMAISLCSGLANTYEALYPNGLVPQFMGPATFIESGSAAPDHHDNYDFSHGLVFNCVAVFSNLATE